jgi:sulfite reductase alpha subunit-like flavoprotein
VAEALRDDLLAAKLNVNLVNAGDYKFKQIASEKLLVVVASTQGEGEPAEEAVALHKFLFSKKAPKLAGTAFAVFGRAIPPMNSSASPVKISTANWRSWAQSACWTASTPMWNTRPRPLNGARVLLRC